MPDLRVRAAVSRRLARLRTRLWGDGRAVGGGVLELKLHLGPGCRIYLGRDTDETVALLWGGHKGTQARDLALARAFWADYLLRA